MSSPSITTASPPASRATARLRPSRTAATTWWRPAAERRALVDGEQGLEHVRVGVLGRWRCRGARTMIERAALRLTISRSVRSSGLPVRQTSRVLPVSPRRCRSRSSISTLSCSARIAMAARRRLRLASTSSDDDRVDLVRPAEDHRVVRVRAQRAALAQLLQPAVEPAGEQTDEGADDEDAAEGEHEPQRQHRDACLVVRRGQAERGDEGLPEQQNGLRAVRRL